MELLLEEQEVPLDLIHKTIREATIAQQICPVLVGSAYKNKGVQLLLDAVDRYLPSPLDREIFAKDNDNGMAEVPLAADPDAPLVAMAFKLVEEQFGQVTYMRIYQGTLKKGTFYFNSRKRKKERISRILRVHADEKEDIDSASAGDIVAVMGIECATGDTYCDEGTNFSLESIYAAEPVIDLAITPDQAGRPGQALQGPEPLHARGPDLPRPRRQGDQRDDHLGHGRAAPGDLRRADQARVQGRLHRRHAEGQLPRGADQGHARINYKHKKQTGGSGQYAHDRRHAGAPAGGRAPSRSSSRTRSPAAASPRSTSPRSRRASATRCTRARSPATRCSASRWSSTDGSYHDVDSSDMAFQICARDCFRETFRKADPVLLEPIMKVEVETPTEFQGPVTGAVSSKRGVILGTEDRGGSP